MYILFDVMLTIVFETCRSTDHLTYCNRLRGNPSTLECNLCSLPFNYALSPSLPHSLSPSLPLSLPLSLSPEEEVLYPGFNAPDDCYNDEVSMNKSLNSCYGYFICIMCAHSRSIGRPRKLFNVDSAVLRMA